MSAPSEDWEDEGWLRRQLDSPQFLAWASMAALVACAWLFLAAMSLGAGYAGDDYFSRLVASICTIDGTAWSGRDFALALIMWLAMTCAMMLPAGAPMLATYMDIAGAAARKDMTIPGPHILAAGYLAVWGLFALLAVTAQWALVLADALTPTARIVNPWIGGAILVGAGLWQFSPTKHACLTKCRRPFTWFMANWRDDGLGVFKMGLKQGVICVACCWALMLVMFVTGLMNLFWMAGLAIVMVAEKAVPNPKPLVYGSGIVLILAGMAMFAGVFPATQ